MLKKIYFEKKRDNFCTNIIPMGIANYIIYQYIPYTIYYINGK